MFRHIEASIERDFIYRHHGEPQVQLHAPQEESVPIPLKHIDVTKATHTNLGFFCKKAVLTTVGMFMVIELCKISWTWFTKIHVIK